MIKISERKMFWDILMPTINNGARMVTLRL